MTKRINKTEILMGIHLKELGIEFWEQYQFCQGRKWAFDFAFDRHFAVEVEGGTGYFKNPKGQVIRSGRHTRQKGFEEDCNKYNTAAVMGWTVFRFSTGQVERGEAKEFIRHWLGK